MTDLKFTSPSEETTIKLEGTGRLGTVAPKTQLHITKMPDKITLELTLDELKTLDKHIEFNDETQMVFHKIRDAYPQPKSPVEEAYKRWMGQYPPTTPSVDGIDDIRWRAFQMGYNASKEEKVKMSESFHAGYYLAQKEKVSEWQPTPQTPEQVADGLKEAFREAVKQGVVSSTKSKTLTDLIYRWWEDVFTTHSDWDMETSIEDLVDQIQLWLPKEHDTNSYKWNECIRTIKEKLR